MIHPLIVLFCLFIWSHFVGDFVLQSNWMAMNKSKHIGALTWHCLVYTACFSWMPWRMMLAVFITHWITDLITSKITSSLWFMHPVNPPFDPKKGGFIEVVYYPKKRHWFFVMIGLDQAIHLTTLLLIPFFV